MSISGRASITMAFVAFHIPFWWNLTLARIQWPVKILSPADCIAEAMEEKHWHSKASGKYLYLYVVSSYGEANTYNNNAEGKEEVGWKKVCIFAKSASAKAKQLTLNKIIEFRNCVWRASTKTWNGDLFLLRRMRQNEKWMRKILKQQHRTYTRRNETERERKKNDGAVEEWCWHIIRFR